MSSPSDFVLVDANADELINVQFTIMDATPFTYQRQLQCQKNSDMRTALKLVIPGLKDDDVFMIQDDESEVEIQLDDQLVQNGDYAIWLNEKFEETEDADGLQRKRSSVFEFLKEDWKQRIIKCILIALCSFAITHMFLRIQKERPLTEARWNEENNQLLIEVLRRVNEQLKQEPGAEMKNLEDQLKNANQQILELEKEAEKWKTEALGLRMQRAKVETSEPKLQRQEAVDEEIAEEPESCNLICQYVRSIRSFIYKLITFPFYVVHFFFRMIGIKSHRVVVAWFLFVAFCLICLSITQLQKEKKSGN
ncbi:hypothetical protein M3Y94_00018300 [Aphelenchoides besseyi]|nr:hypothetical protein M3Y94_00018300 [Aphelenchoides besseyi]